VADTARRHKQFCTFFKKEFCFLRPSTDACKTKICGAEIRTILLTVIVDAVGTNGKRFE
jgi:hypothetical protein